MRISVLCLIIFFTTTLSGCGKQLFPNIKKGQPPPPARAGLSMIVDDPTKGPAAPFFQKLRKSIGRFTRQNLSKIYAVLALAFLWVYARAYFIERNRKQIKYTTADLGLIKNIIDSATIIWRKYRPRRNVIRLDDWSE